MQVEVEIMMKMVVSIGFLLLFRYSHNNSGYCSCCCPLGLMSQHGYSVDILRILLLFLVLLSGVPRDIMIKREGKKERITMRRKGESDEGTCWTYSKILDVSAL